MDICETNLITRVYIIVLSDIGVLEKGIKLDSEICHKPTQDLCELFGFQHLHLQMRNFIHFSKVKECLKKTYG